MAQRKKAAHRRRGTRGEAKTPPTPTPRDALGTQITAAAEHAAQVAKFRGSVTLDAAERAQYGREIQEQFGAPVDDPELMELITSRRLEWGGWRYLRSLRRMAPKYAALLGLQREARRKLLARMGYAESAAALTELAVVSRFEALMQHYEADSEELITMLGRFMAARIFTDLVRRPRRRWPADVALLHTASAVAEWTKQHGRRTDWKATAKILCCHGWDLREALGCSSLVKQAARLEDRVRKLRAHGKGKIAVP